MEFMPMITLFRHGVSFALLRFYAELTKIRRQAMTMAVSVIQDVGRWWPQEARDVRFVSLR